MSDGFAIFGAGIAQVATATHAGIGWNLQRQGRGFRRYVHV